jgi:anti-sigma factor RsiW
MSMNDDWEGLIAAYADGELDVADMARVEAYLAANPDGQRVLAAQRSVSALLRSAFPESLYQDKLVRPAQGMAGAAAPRERGRFVARPGRRRSIQGPAWAVAASVAMAIIGYGAGVRYPDLIESERDRMLTEIAEYHAVYSRETVHLVEVPAAQADHLRAWLGKRVNGTLVIPDFKASGLTFAGGRMVVLDGMPVAELMYTRPDGLPIAFCVLFRPGEPHGVEVDQRGALRLAVWKDGKHQYVVVGEADTSVIQKLAEMARSQI